MLVVDIILIVLLLSALAAGIASGAIASLGALLGLVAGGLAALWLMPIVNDAWPAQSFRPFAVLIAGMLLLGIGVGLGAAIGRAIRSGVDRTAPLRVIDRILGGVASVVVAALAISLVGAGVAATGSPGISSAIASSRVLQTIEQLTPDPIDATLAQLRAAALDDGIPRIAALLGGDAAPTAAPVVLDDPALTQAAASVGLISGVAYACATSSTGSGFVIAPDRVVTNAHVVAGVERPVVQLPGRDAREGTIVYFDPVGDLAVIAVPDLGAPALPIVPTLTPGAAAVVQGYPYGGPFTSVNAQVLSVGTTDVEDIYSNSSHSREIYALNAVVRPGNSGGPLLTGAGEVAGVVFARDQNDENRGYAMTPAELLPVVAQAEGLVDAVPSGVCTTAPARP
ncbi:MarP family serine protease [Microbacterium rhizomatis]|uniref:MarP family serine protease n=1 Tax=Microbacterium rhizomatis TaxID=1631477 RepID=A0A5J5J2D1_9MICO|nr:MarP family serine protease [Microbacterium rhizomatis]KAA9110226.1 MarP family serine protease [Microbacterium rhizomatis]